MKVMFRQFLNLSCGSFGRENERGSEREMRERDERDAAMVMKRKGSIGIKRDWTRSSMGR